MSFAILLSADLRIKLTLAFFPQSARNSAHQLSLSGGAHVCPVLCLSVNRRNPMKRGKMKLGSSIPKTSRLSQVLKLAACGTLGLGAAQSRAETTITFEGFTSDNVSIGSIPGYGNNVTADSPDWNVAQGIAHIVGTPNITLDWSALGWDTYTAWDGRGNVAQTDFNAGPEMSLFFTPSAGAAVR